MRKATGCARRKNRIYKFTASGSEARTLAGLPKAGIEKFGNPVFILGVINEIKKAFKNKLLSRKESNIHPKKRAEFFRVLSLGGNCLDCLIGG